MKMLDIKKVIPNDEFKAVYVTEENAKEFIAYAFPNEYNLDTLRIDKDEYPYVYAVVDYINANVKNSFFILNRWYLERADVIDPDYGWFEEEYFEKCYKIVGDFNG